MSQLNNNNKVQGNGNNVANDLRQIKTEKMNLERRDRQIRFRCDHKDSHGRAAVAVDQETGLLVCRICGTKIDAKVKTKVEVDRKVQELLNIVECIKLAGNPELTITLSKIEEGIDTITGLYEKVILKAGNGNKNKNNHQTNQRKASYNKSML